VAQLRGNTQAYLAKVHVGLFNIETEFVVGNVGKPVGKQHGSEDDNIE
jgi:hypothetical protein